MNSQIYVSLTFFQCDDYGEDLTTYNLYTEEELNFLVFNQGIFKRPHYTFTSENQDHYTIIIADFLRNLKIGLREYKIEKNELEVLKKYRIIGTEAIQTDMFEHLLYNVLYTRSETLSDMEHISRQIDEMYQKRRRLLNGI